MTSSESGEDFESADEDLNDSVNPKCISKSFEVSDDEMKPKTVKSSDVSADIQKNFNNLDLDSKVIVDKVKDSIAGDNLKETEADYIKTRSLCKKLGTKLSSDIKNSSSLVQSSHKELENSLKKTEGNYCIKAEELCVKIPHNVKAILTPITSTNTDNSMKAHTEQDKYRNISKGGDGWEIEEEDGFEIPLSLGKINDRSIQCAQEQISELDQVEFKPYRDQAQGWGGWGGGWGVSSLLSSATGSVSTFSSQVTSGLSTIIETTVGAPNPETLASPESVKNNKGNLENNQHIDDNLQEENKISGNYGGFSSIVSGVSLLGSTVINRGLDTLENLGKKTMEVLQEGDPGLIKKRAMLFRNEDKPVLSQILREAKEKAEHCDKEKEEKETARKVHFESLFDDFQGMVHLEALEMLSTQCELKLQSLFLSKTGPELEELQETLSQVRDLCESEDNEDESEVLTQVEFAEKVAKCVKGLSVNITATNIIQVNDAIVERIMEISSDVAIVINQNTISSLAEFTAAAMELYHKSAELLLAKSIRNTPDEAENYVELTGHLCARISAIANEFTQLLTKDHPIANSSLITSIFLEASNSCLYIKNSCQLLVPILQVGAVSS